MRRALSTGLVVLATCGPVRADEPAVPGPEEIRDVIALGLKIVETGARNYPNHRDCFSCHHQTLPLLAMAAARDAGLDIDKELFREIVDFSRRSFEGRIDSLKAGTGIGGRAMTVGYGLWTLEIAGEKPDDLGEALVNYQLKQQKEDGAWRAPSHRPPLEESAVMCTVLARYGLKTYAGKDQQDAVDRARKSAAVWLDSAKLSSQEDHNARLWGLTRDSDRGDDKVKAVGKAIVERQRDDGGWGQTAEMPSDAYATGQTLFLLLESGHDPSALEIRKGLDFLMKTQGKDGSWHVATRSKPVQVYFDNGDPHGKDQFISISATSWAVAALSRSLRATGAANDTARRSRTPIRIPKHEIRNKLQIRRIE